METVYLEVTDCLKANVTTPYMHGGVVVYLCTFLTLTLEGDEWSASNSSYFTPMERAASFHWIQGH